MVKHVEIRPIVSEDPIVPTSYVVIIRGVTTVGVAFVEELQFDDLEELTAGVSAALVENSVNWGIYDDVTE